MTRLDLPNGQWLDVKDDVKAKDKRDSYEYSGLRAGPDGSKNQDIAALQRHQAASSAIWISAWSIIADGKPVHWPGDRATFKNRLDAVWDLPGRTFDLVVTAVQNHVNAIDNEEVTEKNETPRWRDYLRSDYAICRAMQGWTLDYVRSIDASDYEEIVSWLNDEADRARGGEGSVDMDAMLADRRRARGEEDE